MVRQTFLMRKIRQFLTVLTNNDGNLCALDMSKAFDKLNHYALFIKLMDRNVPLVILNVLVYWYAMCSAVVRWDNMFSSVVQCLQCFDAVRWAAGRASGL